MINYARFVRMVTMYSKAIVLNTVLLAPIIIKEDVLITALNTSIQQLLRLNQQSSLTSKLSVVSCVNMLFPAVFHVHRMMILS